MQRGAIFSIVLVASGNRWEIAKVEHQQQDEKTMTHSPGWVQKN